MKKNHWFIRQEAVRRAAWAGAGLDGHGMTAIMGIGGLLIDVGHAYVVRASCRITPTPRRWRQPERCTTPRAPTTQPQPQLLLRHRKHRRELQLQPGSHHPDDHAKVPHHAFAKRKYVYLRLPRQCRAR